MKNSFHTSFRLNNTNTKSCFDKPSLWLKIMIVREEENVFLFEFGLIVPAVLKCLF